ncbi:AraC family transcriptional regulator [Citrobacter freundii]|uniref:AraC family transcriptional regulator n=1 Tax=Klebsiella michiganensis TaxID=1134687 RepID=A0A2J5QBE2_9ENTR|nr:MULTISPECIES: AraC family transcriptional regulator [Citrobacter]PLO75649.1 AraC family transcriptional regulator [Klebsiella michiganensis]EKU1808837.1 helix-turn-helix domain-containing protein [Citrobacter freundii]EKW1725727.1 helix-turn-helix domain-containing protein [Citrobacter freundii]EKX8166439.1 helix-turn-helix domain-containing protein [Citrobacter freundii]ELH0178808.1 helix-turn-helix domain-containing protein [Citrobacter freundii]
MQIKTSRIEYDVMHSTEWHKHESGQLFWLSQGLMIIETELVQWVVTPGTVGWFPANLYHRARSSGAVSGKCLYPEPSSSIYFPVCSGVYGADTFILQLLERLCRNRPVDYTDSLLKVLTFELNLLPELPLQLTLPEDRRARNVATELLKNPECALNQTQLAHQWGISVRNLSRLFHQETGLTFSQWRQQAKILSSLQWIFAGLPIKEVACLSGYSNVSSYIEIFRERFGKTPGQFKETDKSFATPLTGNSVLN